MEERKREKKNRERLLQLMLLHGLSRSDLAKIAERSESVIRQWLAPDGARDIPIAVLRNIEYAIKDR